MAKQTRPRSPVDLTLRTEAKLKARINVLKKRNPNDATLRNINALKKRVSVLEAQMAFLADQAGLSAAYVSVGRQAFK